MPRIVIETVQPAKTQISGGITRFTRISFVTSSKVNSAPPSEDEKATPKPVPADAIVRKRISSFENFSMRAIVAPIEAPI